MFYDTHAHINADVFDNNVEEIINEAFLANVGYINVVGFDRLTNKKANEIALCHQNIYASAGLHPVDAHIFTNDDFYLLEEYLKQDVTKAVGECGLDYYWNKDTKDIQFEVFKRQIDLSKKYQKPLIIHVRDAYEDAYDILKEASKDNKLAGVMHCFAGSSQMVKKFLDLGLYISLGGPVTFKNAKKPKEVAKVVPIDRLLIETDCPYLTPHPFRGKLNKPSLVPIVAEKIAEIKDISLKEVEEYTTNNAKLLFKI